MSGMLRKLAIVACVGCAVSCSDESSITGVVDPVPAFSHTVRDGRGQSYTLLSGQLPASERSVSRTIGPLGGVLVLDGLLVDGRRTFHALTVPPGAVIRPTLFVMTLSSDEHIEVELQAFRIGRRGRLRSIGHQGFRRPVLLTLSYAFAATEVADPSALVIVHLVGNQVDGVVPSVAWDHSRLVLGSLQHFSRYAVAMN